jgi:prevent-host-death family protein
MDWQVPEARQRFSELLDAAVDGEPQFIRRRDGREVVVVSRELFDKIKPNLKNYLLTAGYAEDADDAFDVAMRTARDGLPMVPPREVDLER